MSELQHLLDKNRAWAAEVAARDPGFFSRLAQRQRPDYLWIGCSDSRVPASRILDLAPGQLFVHRNIGNLAPGADLNCRSVVQFAVEALAVKHIIVCGHYGCGAVLAAMRRDGGGLLDCWLHSIMLTQQKHAEWLDTLPADKQADALCELNVIEQALGLTHNSSVQARWQAGRPLRLHAWIYNIHDGHLRDLGFHCGHSDERDAAWQAAMNKIKD